MLDRAKRIPSRNRTPATRRLKGVMQRPPGPVPFGRSGDLSVATRQRVNSIAVFRNQTSRLAKLLLRKYKMNPDPANHQYQESKYAALRTHLSPGKPGRPVKGRVEQMSLR